MPLPYHEMSQARASVTDKKTAGSFEKPADVQLKISD